MKKQITIQLTMFVFALMFSYLICSNLQNLKSLATSNQSGATIDAADPFDLSELRKWRYEPVSKFLWALNDENEVTCMSKDWKNCLIFDNEDRATKRLGNGASADEMKAIIAEGRVLQCRYNEHGTKWNIWYPYDIAGHWCNVVRLSLYDKWLCTDFTRLNIAIWVDYATKRSLCASTDGQTCATYALNACKALDNSASIVKIDMGYYNSIRKSSPITISGKIFIYNDTFTLPLRNLNPIVASNGSLSYYDRASPTDTINLASFVAPRDLQFMKFYVSIPSLGLRQTPGGFYAKIKVLVKLDSTILSVVEIIQPSDLRRRGLVFNGVASNVKKGPHSLILETITWTLGSWTIINEGRYRIGLEGY